MMYLHTERSSHCFHINPSSVDDEIRWNGEMVAQWHVEPVQSFYCTISGPLIVNVPLIAVLLVHTQFFIESHSVFFIFFFDTLCIYL